MAKKMLDIRFGEVQPVFWDAETLVFAPFPTKTRVVDRRRILRRDNFQCRYCGGHAETVDHVMPRSKGGSGRDENLVAACADCNSEKSDRLRAEFCGASI